MECYIGSGVAQVGGKILFLGDSITDDGRYISFLNAYLRLYLPDCETKLYNLGVSSETVSGLSEPDHPFPRPCLRNRLDRVLECIQPDWAVVCYGINDGIYYPFSQERLQAYQDGIRAVVKTLRDQKIKVALMPPPPFDAFSFQTGGNPLLPIGREKYSYMEVYEGYSQVMENYGEWVCEEGPHLADCVIDVHEALALDIAANRERDPGYISGDGIHPNQHGHLTMAGRILQGLFGICTADFEAHMEADQFELFNLVYQQDTLLHCSLKETIGHDNAFKAEYFVGEALENGIADYDGKIQAHIAAHPDLFCRPSEWNGFAVDQLHFDGYEVIVAKPKFAAKGTPWVWRTEFFGAFPSADLALLEQGWHVAHFNISHQFGCPAAVERMARFHEFIVRKYALAEKPALFGFSRGGLYALHYAAKYPGRVAALYLDAPVVDIRSWPGGKGHGEGSPWDWERCLKAWNLTEASMDSFEDVMFGAISAVLAAKLPLILVAGDGDTVVPLDENGALLAQRYQDSGVPFRYIIKPGVGHHPHSLENPQPILEFIFQNT